MRQFIVKISILFVLLLTLTSCAKGSETVIISVDDQITLEEGTSKKLSPVILIETKVVGDITSTQETTKYDIIYSTNSDKISVSEDGIITALRDGVATVTISLNDDNQTFVIINVIIVESELTKELQFELNQEGTGYIVTGVTEYLDDDIIVPNEYRGLPVVEIKTAAFYDCSEVTSVVISENVTTIGYQVFSGCIGLKNLTITPNLTKIAIGGLSAAFANLENFYFNGTLEQWFNFNLSIYSNTSTFNFFYKENNEYVELTELVVPDTVTTIKKGKFSGNKKLTKIVIPSSVEMIEYGALSGCVSVKSITLPYSISIPNIFGISAWDFDGIYSALSEVIITGGTEVVEGAFEQCYSLKKIVLPDTITTIHDNAFKNCRWLTDISFIENVSSIGEGAFSGCTGLIDIKLSSPFIGEKAFLDCSNLESVEITDNVDIIKTSAFEGCSNIKNVYYSGTIEGWCSIKFESGYSNPIVFTKSLQMKDETGEYSYITDITIPESVTEIESYVFTNLEGLTNIKLSSNIEIINEGALSYCVGLTSITLPASIKQIGSAAFYACENIENVYFEGTTEDWCKITFAYKDSNPMYYAKNFYMKNESNEYEVVTELKIPSTVTSIKNFSFLNMESLVSIELPYTIKNIGLDAFLNCKKLEDVYYTGTIKNWCNVAITFNSSQNQYSTPMHYAKHFYMLQEDNSYYEVKEIEIPTSITIIKQGQFAGFSSVEKIVIHKDVEKIGYCAFIGCDNLKSITLPMVNESFSNIFGQGSLSSTNYTPKSLEEVIINGGTKIGSFTNFYTVTSIIIPECITEISSQAFSQCSKLTIYCERTTPALNWKEKWNADCPVYYGINENNLVTIDGFKYVLDLNKKEAILTKYIGNDETVNIPTSISVNNIQYAVTTIGKKAFIHCSSIKNVVINSGISSINESAFYNCYSLESVYIPSSVVNMGSKSFAYCYNLKIYCEIATIPTNWASDWNYSNCLVEWGYKK